MNFLAIAALIGSLYGQGYYFARSDAGGGGSIEGITFSRVQSISNQGDPASLTVAEPTAGNLLLLVAMERSGTSESAYVVSGITGWTKQIARDIELADGGARRNFVVWTKVSVGSEGTSVSVDNGTANHKRVSFHEFAPSVAATFTFEAQSSADTGTGSTSPLSSGSTSSIGAEDLLIIGVGAWKNQTGAPGTIAFSNSIADIVTHAGTDNEQTISVGFLSTTTGGTKETEVSWTGTGHEAACGILVFSAD